MKRLSLPFLLCFLFGVNIGFGQLSAGTPAPNFTALDIEGNSHTLSDYTAAGQEVIIMFGANWCGPVWQYLETNALQEYYAVHGPQGSNDAVVLYIEGDPTTPLEGIYGVGSNSQGDFTSLVNFPIIHDEQDLYLSYSINYYPTVYRVCTNGILSEIGQLSYDELESTSSGLECDAFSFDVNPFLANVVLSINCASTEVSVSLWNYGLLPLTNCTIVMSSSTSGFYQSVDWEGNLLPGQFDNVNLGSYTGAVPDNILIYVSSTDESADAPLIQSINSSNSGTSHIRIDLLTDGYPEEISWTITNSNNEIVATNPTYDLGETQYVTDLFFDFEDCYFFNIADSYGDGLAWPGAVTGHILIQSVETDGDIIPLFLYEGDYEYSNIQGSFEVVEIVPVAVTGFVYHDANENMYPEFGENGIGGVEVHLDNLITYTDENGMYIFNDVDPLASQLSFVYDEILYPTATTPTSYSLDGVSQYTYNLGLSTNDPNYNLNFVYTEPWFFCGFDGTIWFCVGNGGNQIVDGLVSLTLDPLLTYVSASPSPAIIDGNVLSWNLDDVGLGEVNYFSIQILNPGFEQMGQNIVNQIELITYDDQGNVAGTDEGTYPTVLACSYDPNDKAGMPSGETDSHFIENGTELEYLIRFQNTGNYQAFNIHVLDVIDEDLDLNSLEIISTSHYCQPTINAETREVDFFFPDIMLADSTSNEPASHGFIRYRVLPNPNLAELTPIENTAFIYFDFNPAVVTNTTLHTISDLYFGIDEVNLVQLPVYPNPTNNLVTINLPIQIDNYDIEVVDLQGRVVKRISENYNSIMTLSCSDLSEGTYLVRIISDGKLIYKPAQLNVIR